MSVLRQPAPNSTQCCWAIFRNTKVI